MVPLLWSMLPLCTADNGTSATENGASGCHKKLHSCCKLCLLLLTFIPSPFAAVNSTTIVVVDSSFSSCLWQLKMLLWWLSCFKWFMFFLMLLMGLPAAAAKSAFLAVKCSCRCFLFLLLIMELVCCKGCF
jgi:hypothetical protein